MAENCHIVRLAMQNNSDVYCAQPHRYAAQQMFNMLLYFLRGGFSIVGRTSLRGLHKASVKSSPSYTHTGTLAHAANEKHLCSPSQQTVEYLCTMIDAVYHA